MHKTIKPVIMYRPLPKELYSIYSREDGLLLINEKYKDREINLEELKDKL